MPEDVYARYRKDPPATDMQQLRSLAQRQVEAEVEVEKAEIALKKAKEALETVSEELLPNEMERIGLETFKTKEGLKIQVRSTIYCSIPKEKKEEAMQWLIDNQQGGMIKREVLVSLTQQEEVEAMALFLILKKAFPNVKIDRYVESSTMRANIAEELEEGRPFPMQLFGAGAVKKAKVEVPA